ncbi:hypothetical protein GCM10009839_42320 [Catenulispora yoronensis]|uniref:DUF5666 domain-containing protein n=1 Tax=Catenulispora yoronensis TaxID=450799 RepID=A0ABN2UI89_9ACTN
MSENQAGQSAGDGTGTGTGSESGTGNDEFELLSTAPSAPDIAGQLKARNGGGGLPKVTLALIGVVLAVGGFVGGIAVGKSNTDSTKTTNNAATGTGANRARGFGNGQYGGTNGPSGAPSGANGQFGRGGTVTGKVTAVNGSTLTITDSTGKQVTVDTDGQTTITIGKTGALSDLADGSEVTVIGTPDSSGKITARSVLSGISNFGGFGGGRGARTPSASASSPGGSNG